MVEVAVVDGEGEAGKESSSPEGELVPKSAEHERAEDEFFAEGNDERRSDELLPQGCAVKNGGDLLIACGILGQRGEGQKDIDAQAEPRAKNGCPKQDDAQAFGRRGGKGTSAYIAAEEPKQQRNGEAGRKDQYGQGIVEQELC